MLQQLQEPPWAFIFLSSVISLPSAARERKSTAKKFNSTCRRLYLDEMEHLLPNSWMLMSSTIFGRETEPRSRRRPR